MTSGSDLVRSWGTPSMEFITRDMGEFPVSEVGTKKAGPKGPALSSLAMQSQARGPRPQRQRSAAGTWTTGPRRQHAALGAKGRRPEAALPMYGGGERGSFTERKGRRLLMPSA